MRKVTNRILVACVAALSVGACQDNVIVPSPVPPPTPTGPAVDATVTIQGLRTIPGNLPVNPTNVFGDINVVLNVEEGDNTVTDIDLLLGGQVVSCQDISTSGTQVRTSGSSSSDVVECFLSTDSFVGECDGNQLDPMFENGEQVLGAQITLSDGTTRQATGEVTVTLNNQNTIFIEQFVATDDMGGQAIVGANGRVYYGGPLDKDGDGTDDNTVQFAACPVAYDGTDVGTVSIGGMADPADPDGADVDFGSGSGVIHVDGSAPFLFVADPADNPMVEDDPTLSGHEIANTAAQTGAVLAANGANVTNLFTFVGIPSIYLDFQGPTIAAGSFITIDGAAVMAGHYSTGDFGVTGVTDGGVGVGSGAFEFNVNDDVGGDPLFEDIAGVDTLPEDDPLDDGDTMGVDTYEVELISVGDLLMNPAPAAQFGNVAPNPDGPFGVDRTEPDIDDLLPDTDPADSVVFVLNPDPDPTVADPDDFTIMFEATDPALESGNPGSGVDNTGCVAGCTAITAEADDGSSTTALTVTEVAAGMFSIDISGLADGAYTISFEVPDNAILNPNVATDDFTLIIDNTAPGVNLIDVPAGSVTSSNSSLTFVIEGNSTDVSGIAGLTVAVFDAGVDGLCNTADDVALAEGTDPGEVNDQSQDVTADADDFSVSFTIQNNGAGSGVGVNNVYCFATTSTDNAFDKNGDPAPNTNLQFVRTEVDWQ